MSNVSAYLDRIAYTGSLAPTAEVLRNLHRAHMFAVPFENLDIALKRKIVCDEAAFVQKIVKRRRGGFCYELNGAFAWLLSTIGFRVTLLSARVPREDGTASPEFDHLALRVDLDQPWLADVGFGDSFVEPLLLRTGVEQPQDGWTYRVIDGGNSLRMERADRDGVWKPQYLFTLTPRKLNDFADMCLVPSNFAGVAVHSQERVLEVNLGREDHRGRPKADLHLRRKKKRTGARLGIGVAGSTERTLRRRAVNRHKYPFEAVKLPRTRRNRSRNSGHASQGCRCSMARQAVIDI